VLNLSSLNRIHKMAVIRLRSKNYLILQKNYKKLAIDFTNYPPQLMKRIASFLQKSAKLRAPRASGYLAESITARMIGKNKFIVRAGAYYSGLQEYGYTPHLVSLSNYPQLQAWAMMKGYPIRNYFKVKKYTPFMGPAAEETKKRIPLFIKEMMNKIKKGQSRT